MTKKKHKDDKKHNNQRKQKRARKHNKAKETENKQTQKHINTNNTKIHRQQTYNEKGKTHTYTITRT